MATTKKQTGIRLTDDGRQLLEALSKKLGVSQTSVMEMAVRKLAIIEDVTIKPSAETGEK
jgi:predicted DNA-binding protein